MGSVEIRLDPSDPNTIIIQPIALQEGEVIPVPITFDLTGYNTKDLLLTAGRSASFVSTSPGTVIPTSPALTYDERFNGSEIILKDTDNNTSATFRMYIPSGTTEYDNVVKLTSRPGLKLSEGKLEDYKEKLKDFLKVFSTGSVSSGVLVKTPSIKTFYQNSESFTVEFSKYSCPILLPLGCIEYQIATDANFRNIAKTEMIHSGKELTSLEVTTKDLTPGVSYWFRLRYGTGGEYSGWSDYRGFIVSRPTLPKPVINQLTPNNYVYKDSIPYDVTINITSEPLQNTNHDSSTWSIYEKNDQGEFVKIWTKEKSVTELTNISLTGLYPSTLKYNKTYYIGVVYYGTNINNEFSFESDLVPFCAEEVDIRGVTNLSVYPAIVNVANPILGFDENIWVSIKGKEKLLEYSNIEKIYWEVSSNGHKVKHMTQTPSLNLPAGSLLPNRTYTVKVWYYHTYLGESLPTYLEFTTEKEFVSFRDGMMYPLKAIDGMAYYGDIPVQNLSNRDIRYAGEFTNTRSYSIGEEVSVDGELYICKRKTPTTGFTLKEYFIEIGSSEAVNYYKSGLPTYSWLINNIGLNPYLCTRDIMSGNTNVLHDDVGGWVKCQNVMGKIIYITKTPIYSGVSINDLIKADLFHPRRKTVRIADTLYYVRLLTTNLIIGEDAVDPMSREGNTGEKINYKEDEIISSLLNGKLASFTITDLDIATIDNKELVYDSDKIAAYRIDTQAGMVYQGRDIGNPDDRRYNIRLVLEVIPERERPVYHITKRIPGGTLTYDEEGNPIEYNKWLDAAYLGSVEVSDFLTSLAINEKSGLHLDCAVPNRLWHKFYYRGLIYFLSQGINLSQVDIRELENRNVIYPTPLFVQQDNTVAPINGKIDFNNVRFNLCLPKALNHDSQHVVVKNINNRPLDILNPGTANQEITIAYDSFISDVVYPIYVRQVSSASDPRQIPFSGAKGYKGKYKSASDSTTRIIDNLGSCPYTDYDSTFITCQKFSRDNGNDNYVLNGQRDIYTMAEHNGTDLVDVLFCLTVNPTLDAKNLWKK